MPDFIFRGRKPVNADIPEDAYKILTSFMKSKRVGTNEALAQILIAFSEYENMICWYTTCRNCAGLLDRMYEADARLDQAEATIAGLRGLNGQMEVLAGGS